MKYLYKFFRDGKGMSKNQMRQISCGLDCKFLFYIPGWSCLYKACQPEFSYSKYISTCMFVEVPVQRIGCD